MNKFIAKVVVGLPVEGPFDYVLESSKDPRDVVGCRVRVSFSNRKCVGFIVGITKKTTYKIRALKSVLAILDEHPVLSAEMLAFTKTIAQYYGSCWGEVIELSLPAALRAGRPCDIIAREDPLAPLFAKDEIILVHDVAKRKSLGFLKKPLQEVLDRGYDVLFLVPESAAVDKMLGWLDSVTNVERAVIDKKLSATKNLDQWKLLREGRARIAVGTRSAIFAPVQRPGLIIVWDEDNGAYKEQQAPYYHAAQAALLRGQLNHSRLILTSSAPSVEMWWQAARGKVKMISYPDEAEPLVQRVDLAQYKSKRDRILTVPLKNGIQQTLDKKGKVILFLNRKGFGTMTRCQHCHFVMRCPRCETNLAYRYAQKKMVCPQCSHQMDIPDICPKCQKAYMRFLGMGIERLESEVARVFPQGRIARYDKDTGELSRDFDILIGTSAILRFRDELVADMIGVIQIDAELNRPDFRSAHKVFSLLVNLKKMAKEKFLIQTRFPDHYCIASVAQGRPEAFYEKEIAFRKELGLSPFKHLIAVILRAAKEETVFDQAQRLYHQMQSTRVKRVDISEPQPDTIPKLRGKYRFMMLVKGSSAKQMLKNIRQALKAVKKKSGVFVSVTVDP